MGEPEDGTVRWTFEVPSGDHELFSFAWSDDGVFVSKLRGGDLDLLHLHGADGSVLWNVTSHVCPEYLHSGVSPMRGSNGVVYVTGLLDKDGVSCNVRAFGLGGSILFN